MRMQDLATAQSNVTPVAAAAHISFAQVGGAIATMTAQGMTAQQSTQNLAHFIRSLQAPTLVSSNEMKALGLNANNLSEHLGSTGLAGTLDVMRNAILKNTTGGSVMLGYLKEMSPAAQSLANQILAGSITTGVLTTAVKGLNPEQAHLITLFKGAATSATGLKQTYTQAMSKMVGGATGLNVALMLSGKHMGDLTKNTAAIAARAKEASGDVQGWSIIQSTFNFKLAAAKTGVENTGIAIGTALLPAVTSVLSAVTKVVIPIAEWTAKNKSLTEIIFVTVTAVAAMIAVIAVAKKAFDAVSGAVKTVQGTLKALGLISKETADTQAASAQAAAAAQEEAATEAAGVQEEAAAEAATANEEAAVESSASWLRAAANQIATAAEWAARSAVQLAMVVARNVAAAATTAASWAAAGAQQVAGAAVWVAQSIAKVAIIVATNVAGAAVTLAAWIAANIAMTAGIALIVIAVIAAVVLIVKYWSQISDAAKTAFNFVVHMAETVFNWVKANWPLLAAILLGPFAVAALEIATHYKQILAVISDAINWVRSHWPLLLEILTGPIGMAVTWIVGHFAQIRSGAASLVSDLVHFFTTLPSRIIGALGDVGSMLFGAGERIIQGLISGVENMLGSLGSAMSSVASTVTSFLPFSPAKRGPLSGSGDPSYSGRSIARSLAKGITAGKGDVVAASHGLAGAVSTGTAGGLGGLALSAAGGGGAGAGGATIVIDVHDNHIMSDSDINNLVRKLGPAVVKALGQAGIKVRMP
jgi:hypothetical protein